MAFSPVESQIFSYHLQVVADVPNTAYPHHYDKITVVTRSASGPFYSCSTKEAQM